LKTTEPASKIKCCSSRTETSEIALSGKGVLDSSCSGTQFKFF